RFLEKNKKTDSRHLNPGQKIAPVRTQSRTSRKLAPLFGCPPGHPARPPPAPPPGRPRLSRTPRRGHPSAPGGAHFGPESFGTGRRQLAGGHGAAPLGTASLGGDDRGAKQGPNCRPLGAADCCCQAMEGSTVEAPVDLCDDSDPGLTHTRGASGSMGHIRQKCEVVDLTSPGMEDDDDVVLVSEVIGDYPELVAARGPSRVVLVQSLETPLKDTTSKLVQRRPQSSSPPEPMETSIAQENRFKCAVCWESEVELSCTPCGHIFCISCIEMAVQRKKRCPQCRKGCQKRQLRRLFV
ncbi:unnamed protein product, partial [Ostreobium quekettii]